MFADTISIFYKRQYTKLMTLSFYYKTSNCICMYSGILRRTKSVENMNEHIKQEIEMSSYYLQYLMIHFRDLLMQREVTYKWGLLKRMHLYPVIIMIVTDTYAYIQIFIISYKRRLHLSSNINIRNKFNIAWETNE